MDRTPNFEHLLNSAIGLSLAAIGRPALDRAVQERAAACRCRRAEAYWDYVRASEAELQELIDAVVVSETWFFRHSTSFSALADLVRHEWLPRQHSRGLRILSLACATGEEPYSIAMSLLDAGVPAHQFRVDGVDISTRALTKATRAVYRANAFRGVEVGFRDRHFTRSADGHRVSDAVRRQVRFQRGNLLTADTLLGAGVYDVVFCRNVLIYFDPMAQDLAMQALNRLLTASGLVFVAPAEAGLPASHGFVPLDLPQACAFRKADAALHPEASSPIARRPPAVSRPARTRPMRVRHAGAAGRPTAAPAEIGSSEDRLADIATSLQVATRLADEGHLVEAARCCEEHLARRGPSAEAFYLLGLVRDAVGSQAEAVDCYRKALYLDPSRSEAQIHLAFLMERQGNHIAAQALRDRARRIDRGREVSHD